MSRKATREALAGALRDGILPRQVPDAEMLSRAAMVRFDLPTMAQVRLPDMVVYSTAHSALFFIDIGPIPSARLAELKDWSRPVKCRRVYVSVFASCKDYVERMDDQAGNTFVWFADEPKHHLFLSGSPKESAEYLSVRFATK